jgi:hypothetical protein
MSDGPKPPSKSFLARSSIFKYLEPCKVFYFLIMSVQMMIIHDDNVMLDLYLARMCMCERNDHEMI